MPICITSRWKKFSRLIKIEEQFEFNWKSSVENTLKITELKQVHI